MIEGVLKIEIDPATLPPGPQGPPGASGVPDFYAAETEIDTDIPVTTAATTAWRWIYRLQIPCGLKAGDLLFIVANGQVVNDTGGNVEFVGGLTLSPGLPYYHEDIGAGGYMVGRLNGTNISPQQHYHIVPEIEVYRVPVDMPIAWLHYRVRCRAATPVGSQICQIKQGYGRMTCLVWRA